MKTKTEKGKQANKQYDNDPKPITKECVVCGVDVTWDMKSKLPVACFHHSYGDIVNKIELPWRDDYEIEFVD